MNRMIEIRCPRCNYKPHPHDRWICRCGHVWNTFDTGAICPACGYAWAVTQCGCCSLWSPHRDWYRELITDGDYEFSQKMGSLPAHG